MDIINMSAFELSVRDQIATRGYFLFENILTASFCAEQVSSVYDWLESFGSGFDRSDPTTYTRVPPSPHGLITSCKSGHAAFLWKIRVNAAIQGIFEWLWGDRDLLVSFDGFNFQRPPLRPPTGWAHVDQRVSKPGLRNYQGVACLTNTDAIFRTYPGSHLDHQEITPESKIDWVKIPEERLTAYTETDIIIPTGALLVFDSRLIHHTLPPTTGTRIAAYVSYEPRSFLTDKQLKRKQEAFEHARTTTHWSSDLVIKGDGIQAYGDQLLLNTYTPRPVIQDQVDLITPDVLRLSGF